MAGLKPFFLTGANAKIRVNGITLAFCTNLSYSIAVNHITPQVLGMYEGSSIEPVSYRVSGSFTIIKYTADATSDIEGQDPHGVSPYGNGIGAWKRHGSLLQDILGGFNFADGLDGRAYDNLNPKQLQKASGFEIEVHQKLAGGSGSSETKERSLFEKVSFQKREQSDTLPVAKIRNCRITKADFNLSKKNVATETYQFSALYVDEDTFRADFSGVGQQWS